MTDTLIQKGQLERVSGLLGAAITRITGAKDQARNRALGRTRHAISLLGLTSFTFGALVHPPH